MAVTAIWIALVLIGGVAGVIYIASRTPKVHRVAPGELQKYLAILLRRGYDGGFMVIREAQGDRFLQFAKYIRPGGEYGLEFSFPQAPWSAEYHAKVKEHVEGLRLPARRTQMASGEVREFLEVDCGQNLELAEALALRSGLSSRMCPRHRFASTLAT
jgi:hypothetical protein